MKFSFPNLFLFSVVLPALLPASPGRLLAQAPLFVNEIMASNNNGIADATGAHEDWFEIYNPNDVAVDIAGYYLSDKSSNPMKHKIPTGFAETIIAPYGYLVIWASEKPERGPLHAAFALSASGENVVISAPDGTLIDVVTFGAQTTDVSYGRHPDGSAVWTLYSVATPGAGNAGGVTLQPKLSAPEFSAPGGFKTDAFLLSVTHPDPAVTIRYTTDGSEPVESDAPLVWKYKNRYNDYNNHDAPRVDEGLLEEKNQSGQYVEPIRIDDGSAAANRLSMKSSTASYAVHYFREAPIFKGTVIRAKAFKEGSLPSETVTRTYFVSPWGGERYSMPVISLVSDERSFYDYSAGIYTAGREYDRYLDDNKLTNNNCMYANFTMGGDDWERRGSFELFEKGDAVFNQENVGIRVHGNCSRVSPQKSLRLYSDTHFDHDFFPGQKASPKRLLLRTRGNEVASSEIKDLYCQKLVEFLSFDSQNSKPAIIFMNGEYWGFQSIRERYDRYYLEGKYGVDKDNVDLIQVILYGARPNNYEIDEGDNIAYKELIDFVSNSNMNAPADYEKLKTMIDLDNYTDYHIAQLIIDNPDWPYQNIRLWRTKTPDPEPGAPYGHDGRWRFMFFDADYAFYNPQAYNNFLNATDGESTFATLFRKLLQNQDYRTLISSRIADLLNTHFTAERAGAVLEQLSETFEPLMPEFIDRWKENPTRLSPWTAPQSMEDWHKSVKVMNDYMAARPGAFRNIVRKQLGTELADINLTVNVSDSTAGYIRINKIDITPATPGVAENPYPWTGIYFKTVPIRLTAVPKPDGYFVRWEGPDLFTSTDEVINITSEADALNYDAVFLRKPSLSYLGVNGASLSPGFAPTTTEYSVTIPASTEWVTVTPVFGYRASKASISVNSEPYASTSDGGPSRALTMMPGINKIEVLVHAPDGVGTKLYTITVNREVNPLPVTLISFTGKKSEYTNLLEWKVASEFLFDRYVIERSADAKVFEQIGSVKAVAGESPEVNAYSYTDGHLPLSGSATLYYRLKMINQDGSFDFSGIISLSNKPAGAEPGQIYPNPSNGRNVYIDIHANEHDTWHIATFSISGILHYSTSIPLKKGTNRVAVPVAYLPAGLYIVLFKNSLQQEIVRRVVIN